MCNSQITEENINKHTLYHKGQKSIKNRKCRSERSCDNYDYTSIMTTIEKLNHPLGGKYSGWLKKKNSTPCLHKRYA